MGCFQRILLGDRVQSRQDWLQCFGVMTPAFDAARVQRLANLLLAGAGHEILAPGEIQMVVCKFRESRLSRWLGHD